MLTTLNIKNVALISALSINFEKGLNVLSGETGAGKSIIIDSLSFALGGKADKSMIRSGCEVCEVTASFETAAAAKLLASIGIEEDEVILLKRSMDGNGKSKSYINGQAVPNSMLKTLAGALCDIHGQSEHHSLMKVASHIELLDKFAGDKIVQPMSAYCASYQKFKDIKFKLSEFGGSNEDRARTIDLLSYQINEINDAEIGENELDELTAKRKKMLHLEKLIVSLKGALGMLSGDEISAVDSISQAVSVLGGVADFDENVAVQSERLASLKYEIADVGDELENILVSYDDEDSGEVSLDRLDLRIDKIKNIYKKYGKDYTAVMDFLDRSEKEYNRLTHSEEIIKRLNTELVAAEKELQLAANMLTKARGQAASLLEEAVHSQFKDLGLKNAQFKIQFEKQENSTSFCSNGCDSVEFFMTANPGQPLKPLVKVISGGEASRFMLAIKAITGDIDGIDALVFDEIDTGISGEIAQMVAAKFIKISQSHQLITITHLPQIAACGDSNYLIEKYIEGGGTLTKVVKLGDSQKELEVARLAGGNNIGEHGVLHARELIAWAKKLS